MSVARLNLSHGDLDEHGRAVAAVRAVEADACRPVAILADLPGPKVRLGDLAGGELELSPGSPFELTATGTPAGRGPGATATHPGRAVQYAQVVDQSPTGGSQRILGIVGGMGPESTLDYYRMAIDLWRHRTSGASHPRLLVDSLDGERLFELGHNGAWEDVGDAIADSLLRLGTAGAGMALIASNTAHLALDAMGSTATPFIHIVDATAARAVHAGYRRLGLLGTRYTMTSSIYPGRLERAGIDLVTPADEAMDFVHEVYFGELVKGVFRAETRARLEAIVATMRDRDRVDGVILGGTELALILTGESAAGIPLLNTARIHVEAGLAWLAGG